MNLPQKYAVKTLNDIVGQDKTVQTIKYFQTKQKEWPQVIYFEGLTGTGKTSFSNIVGQSKVCTNLNDDGSPCLECAACKDISENKYSYGTAKRWNAREVKLNVIEEIKDICNSNSMLIDHIVLFVDEAQYLLPATVEELHTIIEKDYHGKRTFIFSAMEKGKIVRSLGARTAKFKLQDIPTVEIGKKLIEIAIAEGYKIDSQEKVDVLTSAAQYADGSMRDGIHYLQSILDMELWTANDLAKELGIVTNESLLNMCGMLIEGDYKVFNYEWNPEILTAVRRMLFTTYKIQKGVEVPDYLKKQTGSLSKLSSDKVRFALNKIMESLGLPYINNEIVELTVLDILENNSNGKQVVKEEEPKVRTRARV